MSKLSFRLVRLFLVFIFAFQLFPPLPAFAQMDTWTAVNSPSTPGGTISAMQQSDSNPNILYALIDNSQRESLFRSSDRGEHWILVHQFDTRMYNLAIDPENPDIVYAGAEDGLWRSINAGQDWQFVTPNGRPFAVPASAAIYTVEKMDNSPESCEDIEYAFTWSLNGGADWQSSDLGCYSNVGSIVALNSQPNLIYVVVGLKNDIYPRPFYNDFLLRSQDGGHTWQSYPLDSDSYCPGCAQILIDPQNPQHIYSSLDAFFMSSLDGGQTWDINFNYNLGVNCSFGCAIRMALSGSDIYAVPFTPQSEPAYRSLDGGKTWWQSINILPSGAHALIGDVSRAGRLYAGLDGYGVYLSDDFAASWVDSNLGIQTTARLNALAVAPSNPAIIYAASDYPRPALFRTLDGGQTWSPPLLDSLYMSYSLQPAKQGIRIDKIAINPVDPSMVWAGGRGGLYELDGNHWDKVTDGGEIIDLKLSPAFPDRPYALFHDDFSPVCYLLDKEITPFGDLAWTSHPIVDISPQILAIDPAQSHKILFATNRGSDQGVKNEFYASVDNGKSFEKLGEISRNAMMRDLFISPSNGNLLFEWNEALLSDLVFTSTDGGRNWIPWAEGLTSASYFSFFEMDPSHKIAYFGSKGVSSRALNGAKWQSIGLEGQEITAMSLSSTKPQFLLAATHDGLWRLDLFTNSIWLPSVAK
jgi:hypothetical protein